ncbi:MAG TPA: DUF167 domain-containing protein [Candidatus Eisenbacteria bacterium]
MSAARARFRVRVTPKSRADEVSGPLADGTIRVRVRAPAEGGRANEAVVALLGAVLGLPRGAVRIAGGRGGRAKWIEAEGLTSEEAVRRLGG